VEPELVERYVENGTVRYEWRDFAYLGQESVNAALAAMAAHGQGRFWEYHDVLYENQGSVNSGAFSDETLVSFAEEVGLDTEQFEAALTSGGYESVVQSDLREAQNAGIQGTPSFTINGQRIVGPQPLNAFEQLIEAELTKAGG